MRDYTQRCRRGDPTDPASPPVDPTSPMCAPRDDNHNTPEPAPPERRRGYAFSQSEPANSGCPTYGVAVAVQGGGRGVFGEGPRPWEARTCRVQGGREAERRQASRT